ncbi:ComEA family DNA-binding protein [Anaerovibrio sp. JC8]|uniref:ComEA family DNA-binding protein n=1 Tax=Anaerovibrio sp. JC8 TaxID=1240085 RepID=UPI001301E8AB|nr:ComEA family DNA-binding protein [Anaerovibrio sp. JC8]
MFKKSMLVLAVILLITAAMTYWQAEEDNAPEMVPASEQFTAHNGAEQYAVYVCGAVKNPGVVLLSPNSRVGEAVNSCGGLLPNANAESINMAEGIKDGMQITVKARAAVPAAGIAATGTAEGTGDKININTAGAEELTKIPGIGKTMAQRILDYRTQNGPFTAVEELKKIKGIGKSKYEKMAPRITI